MQSGYDINHLAREAQTRWLKPVEVYFILQNSEEHQLTHQIPQKPASGSLFLFNKRVLKFFRKDGHSWRRRKDQRTIAEAHERLKVGNVEAINCYYAHGENNSNFQRRSYWMLDPAYEHIVLVHYRDISKGRENNGSTPQFSTFSSPTFSLTPNSFATDQPESSVVIGESRELYHNESSPSSVEITSGQLIMNSSINPSDYKNRTDEVSSTSLQDLSQALRRLEQQLSLNDDETKKYDTFFIENEESNDLEDVLRDYEFSGQPPNGPKDDGDIWEEMLHSSKDFANDNLQEQFGRADDPSLFIQETDSLEYPAYTPGPHSYENTPDSYSLLFKQDGLEIPLENNISLTISQKQKFTIREISPEWCYTSEGAKIFIIGSFLCDPSESSWACMVGDTQVLAQVIQEGVLCCHAPPHLHGKVNICITCGNRESCSEVREFEYRPKPNLTSQPPETDAANKSSEELLLLVRLVQMLLLSNNTLQTEDASESRINLFGKSRNSEDSWSHIIDSLLVGSPSTWKTLDWLVQELVKEKLEVWVSSKLQKSGNKGCCSLSKKEQGIIHMVAGLGFEWALQPILNSGVSINFRDINGWTALHWAARFGRLPSLIASGASAGAVTDPNSQDPTGKTPASIAATCGHRGLAGYLSEVALTTHLSSLTLAESELSKGAAAIDAERAVVNSLSKSAANEEEEEHDSLRHTLAAVRNAAQAAARIQSAFRAHSFRKRQQREAATDDDDFSSSIIANGASKLAFRNSNSAALSIQKKYRGWKGRKDFLALRQKVVKIQAHVRGYQVRKNYKVCWAVGILEKVILRWRRHGVGLRGFRLDSEQIDDDDEEDILKVFRKQKVDDAIDEAVSRVLSMVDSPTARHQYHRLLLKYRQAKAELETSDPDMASSSSSSQRDITSSSSSSYLMGNDEIY
ncbi:calmodulin-binding family protein [Striga asiatica]|uniref:Calmodulin-binding family protein n=1 Tax=Striga asiatica TaxID=4170 RepID=A0A5A7QHE4_STRAF|nr:calmodulin-binding family protein [Striga asiatica]